jgi:hypothetical protein
MSEYEWTLGLLIALVGGFFGAWAFDWIVRSAIRLPDKPSPEIARIPPWLTGFVERLLFFLLIVTLSPSLASAPAWMLGWLGLKLGANWNRYKADTVPDVSTRALLALLTGAISLAFAFAGGIFAVGAMRLADCTVLE